MSPAPARKLWTVPLPRGAEPPIRVFVNGVAQKEGVDYEVEDHALKFPKHLEKERVSVGRWAAIFLGLWGSYKKNDSVDVHYRLGGVDQVAVYLDIIPPE